MNVSQIIIHIILIFTINIIIDTYKTLIHDILIYGSYNIVLKYL